MLDWQAGLSDLRALAATLDGGLTVQGHAAGRTDDLSASADLAGRSPPPGCRAARRVPPCGRWGCPRIPPARSPPMPRWTERRLSLAVQAARAGGRGDGGWGSTGRRGAARRRRGRSTCRPGALLPLGTMTLKIADPADFARLAGQRLTGSVEAGLRTEQQDGAPVAVLDLTARNAGLPGQASARRGQAGRTGA